MQTAAWTMAQISVATMGTVYVEHVNARSETTQRSAMKGSTVNVTTSTVTDRTTSYVEVRLHTSSVMYFNICNVSVFLFKFCFAF